MGSGSFHPLLSVWTAIFEIMNPWTPLLQYLPLMKLNFYRPFFYSISHPFAHTHTHTPHTHFLSASYIVRHVDYYWPCGEDLEIILFTLNLVLFLFLSHPCHHFLPFRLVQTAGAALGNITRALQYLKSQKPKTWKHDSSVSYNNVLPWGSVRKKKVFWA